MIITKAEKIDKLKAWLAATRLDSEVTNTTVGVSSSSVDPKVLLAATVKLVKINKKEAEPDDRDNLRFSTFHGLEDFVAEHIEKDAGRIQKKARMKLQQKRDLSWLHPSFFTPQVRSVIIGNSLAQNVEGINPLEHFDNSHRVTKLGEGGIPSTEAVPDSSRQVNTSSFGFFDPVHISESENVGVSNYIAANVVKGKDKKLYRVMKDPRTGKLLWVDHETILHSRVKIPEE
jgi:DNA-directed RNA polymerase beta subunit